MFLLLVFPASLTGQINTTEIDKLFEMSLSDLMNQEVITTSRFLQKSNEAASSVAVITSDDIEYYGYSTLGEALNSCSGFFLSDDKNYLYAGSRGYSRPGDYNNRMVVMVDGHIINEVIYGSALLGNDLGINLKNIEKIEIVKGPGASVYGSGAMLNTINIIMKKGVEVDGFRLSAGTGSFGKNEFAAAFGKEFKGFDISASAIGGLYNGEDYFFTEMQDDAVRNHGVSEGMDWEKYAGFHANISRNNFTISGLASTRLKGIPTGAFGTNLTGEVNTNDSRWFVEASYKKDLGQNSSLLFRAFYDDYYYFGQYPTGPLKSYDASKGSWAGTEIQYFLKAGERNIITAGFEYKYVFTADYREWTDSEVYFDENYPFSFFSFYAQDQFRIVKNLHLTAGLRYDQYSLKQHSLSPRLALVYSYSGNSFLKLLYSEAFRTPSIYETFYASQNVHIANPDINPEIFKAFEFAWGHSISEHFFTAVSAYSFHLHNLIEQTYDETEGVTQFTNIGKAEGIGIESELKYLPAKKGGGYVNLSLQKAMDEISGTKLSNSPQFLIRAGLVYPVSKYVYLSPEFCYESGRLTLHNNKTDNVYLFNLSLRTAKFFEVFDFSLKVRNLLNLEYYTPAGYEHDQEVLRQNSRSIYIQINAHF